jgi:phenylacetate-CoA ligase
MQGGLHFLVEEETSGDILSSALIDMLESKYNIKLQIEVLPKGTLYNRDQMLAGGLSGKPRYIYSAQEIEQRKYRNS